MTHNAKLLGAIIATPILACAAPSFAAVPPPITPETFQLSAHEQLVAGLLAASPAQKQSLAGARVRTSVPAPQKLAVSHNPWHNCLSPARA